MRSQSLVLALRYLVGVKASSTAGPQDVVDAVLDKSSRARNLPASQRYLSSTEDSTQMTSMKHRAVQLRVGGAQMLTSTSNRIYNHNEAHPLFFSRTSPKESGLCHTMVEALRRLNIRRLTELQGALVPLLLRGKHVIAHAETGTGKSFGIALATANRIVRDQLNHRLHTLILVPTEELALQYDKWLKHFCGCASQVSQPAVESIPLESQLAKLHNIQPNVLIGTCQRISDIYLAAPTIINESLRRRVDCVILDEADMLLQCPVVMGHRKLTGADLIDRIFRHQPDEVPAQMVATSATIDGATAQRLNAWMRNDKAVRVTTSFVEYSIPDTLTFYFFPSAVVSSDLAAPAIQLHPSLRRSTTYRAYHSLVEDSGAGSGSSTRSKSGEVQRKFDLAESLEVVLRLIFRQSRVHQDNPTKRPRIMLFAGAADVDEVVRLLESKRELVLREWTTDANDMEASQAESRRMRDEAQKATSGSSLVFCASLHDPPDPSNPNRHIKARELIGRNKEIFVRNDSNISKLNMGELLIGVCSFELSRGMHVSGISHVIMYGEVPPPTDFVHCAGRTGRMGREGDVICIFPPAQGKNLQTVCQALEIPLKMNRISAVAALLSEDHGSSFMTLDGVCSDDESRDDGVRDSTAEGTVKQYDFSVCGADATSVDDDEVPQSHTSDISASSNGRSHTIANVAVDDIFF